MGIWFKRSFRFLFSLYALLLLVLAVILLLPILLVLWCWPEKKRGDLFFSIIRFFISLFFLLTGIRPALTSNDSANLDTPRVFIFNHLSYLDALVVVHALGARSVRGLGKYEFSKFPLIGSIYKQAVILVKRGDKADRARSVALLKATLEKGTSIFLAPEGTFNETGKPLSHFYDGAFRIAIETQTPLTPILFLDTFDRLSHTSVFSFNPGKSRVIFLQTFDVANYTIEDLPLFKEKVFSYMEEVLISEKASWILNDSFHD